MANTVRVRYIGVKPGGTNVNFPIGATTRGTIKESIPANPFIEMSEEEAKKLVALDGHNFEIDKSPEDEKNASKNIKTLLAQREEELRAMSPYQLARLASPSGQPIDEGRLQIGEIKTLREEMGVFDPPEDTEKAPGAKTARAHRKSAAKKAQSAAKKAQKAREKTVKEVRVKVTK